MSEQKATLCIDGKTIELPVYVGTEGDKAIDISKLFEEHGLITYDPSLGNTGFCRSEITYIDGDKGILRYRGIPIEQFAVDKPNFITVAYLLIFGKLPTQAEYLYFRGRLSDNAILHEGLRKQLQAIPPKSPPMAILSASLSQMACFHPEFLHVGDEESFTELAARLISKVRTIAACSYRSSLGLPFMYPDPNLRYCANFLHMMFSIPYRQYDVIPEVENALNLALILHADHEQNCSTTTVRTVGSAKANLFASCAAGVSALWGPLHGGANVQVMEMLTKIHKGRMKPQDCINAAKDKADPFKLFGFGHRVYKNYDPRAKILKEACDKVFSKLDMTDPLLEIAMELEELALNDEYFIERKLYPNVDFYSGILFRAIGIPTNMFTVLFAIGRLPGWIAQWKEQHDAVGGKIVRPRQLYQGNALCNFLPEEAR